MVRITLISTEPAKTIMKLEGRIVSEWIKVVESEGQNMLAQGQPISLDLSGVSFVAPEGVHMIRRLLRKGCALVNCPLFIQKVLLGT